jgi:hypothetical protein
MMAKATEGTQGMPVAHGFSFEENGATPMLPNLIIIGAMKCGTTSLHYYLGLHPQISMSAEKELKFFVEERNWPKGRAWYESKFPVDAPVRGEASPSYTFYPVFDGVPERMYGVVPDAKLIYVVRDPVERLISQYRHDRAEGKVCAPLEEAILPLDESMYVSRSKYAMQLERFLAFYPLSRILILTQEELKAQRRATIQKAFRFLGVDESFASWKFNVEMHGSRWKRRTGRVGDAVARSTSFLPFERLPALVRGPARKLFTIPFSESVGRPSLSDELQRRIADELRADIHRFREITGMRFDSWSV